MTMAMHALHAASVLALLAYVGLAFAVLAGFGRDAARRWAAALLFAAAVATGLFHALAVVGVFGPGSATLALVVVAGCAHLALQRTGAPTIPALFARDVRRVARVSQVLLRSPRALLFVALALIAFVVAARVMLSPPLAWDALTYHALKPALWLQSGGDLLLDAPGGWSTHRGRLPGAEIVATWAMLPGPGDAFWGAADLFFWLALAVGLQTLGRALGLRARERGAITLFGCFVPVVMLSVGSGYVELPLAAILTLSLGLMLHAHRTRHGGAWLAATTGIALLTGMKLTIWPGVAVLSLLALAVVVSGRFEAGPRRSKALAWGLLALVCIALPSPLRQFFATGYPLSVPLQLGPFALGPANAELDYLETLARETAHGWQAEAEAIAWVFGSPLRLDPHFAISGALALVLAAVGAARTLRTRRDMRVRVLWMLATSVALWIAWFAPPLETVRLHWAKSNARHWMPIVLPLLPLAFAGLKGRTARNSRPVRVACDALLLAAVVHGALGVTSGWPPGFALQALVGAVVLLAAVVAVSAVARRAAAEASTIRTTTMKTKTASIRGTLASGNCSWLAAFVVTALVAGLILVARTPQSRWQWYEAGMTFGWTPRYWVPAARHASDEAALGARPLRIAVTGGPHPPADGWFMQPFLGHAGTNAVVYVSVTDSPLPRALAPGHGRTRDARYARWSQRLVDEHIDYVMAYWPTQLELGWMQARPERFVRIDGDGQSWGFFRVEAP